MTTTSNSKENGRSHKSKRRSVSNAASPSDEQLNGNLNGTDPASTSSGGGARTTKRVRDGTEEPVEEKKPRSLKRGAKVIEESDMAVDGEGDGDEDGGDTRCVCGKGDSDEGGLMVMCETCKVWQHTQCMGIPDDNVPDHYWCEQCMPDLHTELLKRLAKLVQKRPRRRSSATRTMQKQLSSSPSPPAVTQKVLGKRRNTMNSRATTYEEEMAAAIQASKNEFPENEDEDEIPIVIVGPRKR
ncbi:hypothetical protein M408DRAFT_21492, partial [Serendipita vermifera MAFF 305830]